MARALAAAGFEVVCWNRTPEAADAIAQFSTLWLCCAPNRRPAPFAVRSTRGSDTWPSVM